MRLITTIFIAVVIVCTSCAQTVIPVKQIDSKLVRVKPFDSTSLSKRINEKASQADLKDSLIALRSLIANSSAVVNNVTINDDVARLSTVIDLQNYSGKSVSLIIADDVRGGLFNIYTGSYLADNGMIFLDALERKWKRQTTNNKISILWYGAIPSTPNVNDNDIYKAFIAARDYAKLNKGTTVYVPSTFPNLYGYFCSQTLSFVNMDISIEGENIGATGHNTYSTINFPFNVMGFDLNCTIQGEYFATIKNLKLSGRGDLGVTYDNTKHGIQTNAGVNFENIFVSRFSGDGIHITGYAGTLGNSDRSQFVNCETSENNNGFYISGYDANTMVINNCSGDNNRRWGVYDNGFLGNNYLNFNTANNGTVASLPAFIRTQYNGINYIPISNDDFNNTNVRPDLNPLKWRVFENGMPQPLWDSTKRYYSGGSYCSTDQNGAHVYVGNYQEDFQPGARYGERSLILGGQHNEGEGGGFLTAYGNALVAKSEMTFEKRINLGVTNSSKGYIDFAGGIPSQKNVNIGADVITGLPNIYFFADGSTQVLAQSMAANKPILKVTNNSFGANLKTFVSEMISDEATSTLMEAKSGNYTRFKLFGNGRVNLFNYNSPNAFTGTPVANLQVDAQGNMITGALVGGGYTVATLPAGTVGMMAYVTDATAPTYLGTLTGGGTVKCPVFYNGTAWVSH